MGELIIMLFQEVSDLKEFLTIKDVSIIGVLLVVLIYFGWENRQLKKDLAKAIEERVNDLKDSNKYSEVVMQQFNNLANDLKDMIRGNK